MSLLAPAPLQFRASGAATDAARGMTMMTIITLTTRFRGESG